MWIRNAKWKQKLFNTLWNKNVAMVSKVISQEAENVISINNLCIEFKFKQINEVSFYEAQGQQGRLLGKIYNFNFSMATRQTIHFFPCIRVWKLESHLDLESSSFWRRKYLNFMNVTRSDLGISRDKSVKYETTSNGDKRKRCFVVVVNKLGGEKEEAAYQPRCIEIFIVYWFSLKKNKQAKNASALLKSFKSVRCFAVSISLTLCKERRKGINEIEV